MPPRKQGFPQVEATAEIYDGADDERLSHCRSSTGLQLACEFSSSLGIAFPGVDAMAEPVPSIHAGLRPCLSGNDLLADLAVTTVEAEDELT